MASSNPLKLEQGGLARQLLQGQNVRSDLRLLEVDAALLGEILQAGVVIKGQEDGDAVLCTSSKTYALKYVETTNAQLLVRPVEDVEQSQQPVNSPGVQGCGAADPSLHSPPGLQTQLYQLRRGSAPAPVVVTATTSGHIEVIECGPRLELLHALLAERPYGQEDEEEEQQEAGTSQGEGGSGASSTRDRRGLYMFEDLVRLVQASPKELQAELAAVGAVELAGHWRSVDADYLGQLLELIILSAQQEGHPLTAIPVRAMADALTPHGYLPQLVTHCLRAFGRPSAGSGGRGLGPPPAAAASTSAPMEVDGASSADADVVCLDEGKVCVHFMDKVLAGRAGGRGGRGGGARVVAPAGSTEWPLAEFMQQWREAVPSSMHPDPSMLQGEVLIEGKGADAVARPLSVRQLPLNPKQRFAALFAIKPQWEASELEPYLRGLQAPGQTPAMLLLKFTRASQAKADAPMFYTAR